MSTIEITRIEDLREGDYVTLRWEKSEGGTVTLEGPMRFRATVGGYVITDARFVSATREVPEWEPGTAGTATVRCVEGVRVMRTSGTGGADVMWLSASMVSGVRGHEGCHVTDFLPDDAEALRAEVERLRAARPWVTRQEIADAFYPDAVETARAILAESDSIRRVHALVNGTGGAS